MEGIKAGVDSFFRVFVHFIIFVRIAHFMTKSQGGVNNLNLVTFFFSLFWVPILLIITFVPIIRYFSSWPLEFIPLIFFGQIALRSTMVIKEVGKGTISVIVASIAIFLVGSVEEGIVNFIISLL